MSLRYMNEKRNKKKSVLEFLSLLDTYLENPQAESLYKLVSKDYQSLVTEDYIRGYLSGKLKESINKIKEL
jgi:hypothetical protein